MATSPNSAYLRYQDLTLALENHAREHPDCFQLESIGKSHEGREIWLVTMTRFATGAPKDKPALWVDANIHSMELVSGAAALNLIRYLLEQDGKDSQVTRCLDGYTFYICPRVNPDGVEWALADTPRWIRSSTRPWPDRLEPIEGLEVEDMDRDGRILSMRIPDANGPWKICAEEPRLLVRREPGETGGEYYRLMPEGRLLGHDTSLLPSIVRRENLDLNRNFPAEWKREHEQPGAGPYPASEPEVRALVDFVTQHPNICSGIALHSYSGVLLYPFSHKSDDHMPAEDRWVFEAIGRKGTDLTGYPAGSAFSLFRYHPQKTITGAMDDWLYENEGRLAWTVELWNPLKQAGIETGDIMEWYRQHPVADDIKLLQWSDRVLQGKGYIDWYTFDHPQLGPVELGGWDGLYSWWNPPAEILADEISGVAPWLVWHNLVAPRLQFLELQISALGNDLWQVRSVVQNTGWLPTDVTRLARNNNLLKGVEVELEDAPGIECISHERRVNVGELEGYHHKPSAPNAWSGYPADPTDERAAAEWIVRAGKGTKVSVRAYHPRAGTTSISKVLE